MKHLKLSFLLLLTAPCWADSALEQCHKFTAAEAQQRCAEELVKQYEEYFRLQGLSIFRPTTQTLNQAKQVQQAEQSKAESEFGVENKKQHELSEIVATIVSTKKDPYGYYILYLDNQQTWKLSDKGMRLSKGDSVVVKRGALGSFFLSKEGNSRKSRAKRID